MLTCPACGGLTPRTPGVASCLHCDGPLTPPRGLSLLRLLLGPAGAVLLAACYGPPPGRYNHLDRPTSVDRDGDGTPADADCDDNDRNRYPGAADIAGDGNDQNCDGVDGWRDPGNTVAEPPPES
jgi:hypothetical protein